MRKILYMHLDREKEVNVHALERLHFLTVSTP